jgi:hypothetical protein
MNTEKHIADLLFEHDCVIIPGFGGFIGNYQHARIHPVHHTFFPPSKSVLFNINLRQNDGLLASRIAFTENIPYEKALQNIQSLVESWNKQLKEQQFLLIDQIGKLILNREGNLQFEQGNSINFLSDSFGLASFVSPAIRRPGFQVKMEKRINRYLETPSERRRILPKTLKWAAVLILPLGMATYFGITNFNVIKNLKVNYSSLFYSAPVSTDTNPKVIANTFTVHTPDFINNKTTGDALKNSDIATAKAVQPVTNNTSVSSSEKPFAIIVGAFRLKENADNLVTGLRQKGFDALIYDTTKTGLFRVSLGTFSERDQALQQLASVRLKDFASAWLLAR